jgi:hypothetical protein
MEAKLIVTVAVAMGLIGHWFLRVSHHDRSLFWWLRDPVYTRNDNLTDDGRLNTFARVVLVVAALIVLAIVWLS